MLRLGFCPINTILVKLDGLTSLKRQGVEPRCSGMGPVSPAPAGVSVPSPLGQPGLGVVRREGTHVSFLLWGLVLQQVLCNDAPTPIRGPLFQDPVLSPWPSIQRAIRAGTHPDPVQSQQRTT